MWTEHSIRVAKAGYIAVAIAFLALGLLLMIFPETSLEVLCSSLGIILLVYGTVKILGYFSNDLYQLAFQFDFALGILSLFIGIMLLWHPKSLIAFTQTVIGIIILNEGLFKMQTAMDAKRFGMRSWILMLVLAVAAGVAGVLVAVHPTESSRIMMSLTGLSIFIEGLLSLCAALLAVKVMKRHG